MSYISRQASIEAIMQLYPSEPILPMNKKWWKEKYQQFLDAEKALHDLPSAPVREVVMCKDCAHWDTSWQNDYEPNCHYCPMIDNKCNGDFYCGHAERKEQT